MIDVSRMVIAPERSGGWVGQPLDRVRFAAHLNAAEGGLPCPPWRFHIAGYWYGGRWWSLAARVASQN